MHRRSPPSSPRRSADGVPDPVHDIQGLLQRGQVADITAEVEALPYAADFNRTCSPC